MTAAGAQPQQSRGAKRVGSRIFLSRTEVAIMMIAFLMCRCCCLCLDDEQNGLGHGYTHGAHLRFARSITKVQPTIVPLHAKSQPRRASRQRRQAAQSACCCTDSKLHKSDDHHCFCGQFLTLLRFAWSDAPTDGLPESVTFRIRPPMAQTAIGTSRPVATIMGISRHMRSCLLSCQLLNPS